LGANLTANGERTRRFTVANVTAPTAPIASSSNRRLMIGTITTAVPMFARRSRSSKNAPR
jgi:hypothetical protein